MSKWRKVNKTLLMPQLVKAVDAILDEAEAAGCSFYVTSGFRSFAQQWELYEQGRSRPGQIVTNARAGDSAHNFGLAADLCLDDDRAKPGLQPNWSPEKYEVLGPLCAKYGLEWGGNWKFRDAPHVQIPGFVTAAQLKPLREDFVVHGSLELTWALVAQATTKADAPVKPQEPAKQPRNRRKTDG